MDKPSWKDFGFATRAVRAGTERSDFGEHSEALYLTSSYVFDDAEQAARRFQNQESGPVYSRFTNPSVQMFEERLAALENAEECVATCTGMAAILSVCLGLLKAGDEIVTTGSLFGATIQLFDNFIAKFGVGVRYVPLTDPQAWKEAITPQTRLFYLETPSNPLLEIADLQAIGQIAREAGVITVVDNCFCTPALQQPLRYPIDLVLHSATKYIDGQGRVLGGAVAGLGTHIEKIRQVVRTCGPTLSPFNAWVLHKSLETLQVRMRAHSESALALAQWLQSHPSVARVIYPGLESHPQHALAMQQQSAGGAIVSFELKGSDADALRQKAFALVNATEVFSRTGNLGDTRSIMTHPASTTHGRISEEARARAGITQGLIRLAVGLEDIQDLQRDLARGL
ncbi:MAG: O-succinylhomoserine sulfhydrylase [Betaproteobacteria bacterium]|nr:O-succinylhomoserine sulfhydrylase [Betaproteobacteria bacterium]NBT74920.1 O-succinylhomoserine sulfhydrylase [Betaproteobacteria bacterium]NBY13218.1 O-succinylhomoserine sulfhydrylase [Betaproteobacteria bacterium]NCA15752.1 O-succinylhomoserine sulfhydrylase [Betaproteobacteria bacterium]